MESKKIGQMNLFVGKDVRLVDTVEVGEGGTN